MPDIDELLRLAARPPESGPDLGRVATRARTLRRRQHAARGAVVVLAVLLAVPLLRPGGGTGKDAPDLLEQVPIVSTSPAPAPTGSSLAPSRDSGGSPLAVGTAARPTRAATAPSQSGEPIATSPSVEPSGNQTVAPQPGETLRPGYPLAASCHVSTTDLAPDESRSCRFTATADGGWRVKTTLSTGYVEQDEAEVLVERAGRTYRYLGGFESAACGDDVIQPGDLVTVTVRQSGRGYRDIDLAAGEGYDCKNG